MVKYYDALSNNDLQTICECFDIPSKLISLYGVVNITKEDIKKPIQTSSKHESKKYPTNDMIKMTSISLKFRKISI